MKFVDIINNVKNTRGKYETSIALHDKLTPRDDRYVVNINPLGKIQHCHLLGTLNDDVLITKMLDLDLEYWSFFDTHAITIYNFPESYIGNMTYKVNDILCEKKKPGYMPVSHTEGFTGEFITYQASDGIYVMLMLQAYAKYFNGLRIQRGLKAIPDIDKMQANSILAFEYHTIDHGEVLKSVNKYPNSILEIEYQVVDPCESLKYVNQYEELHNELNSMLRHMYSSFIEIKVPLETPEYFVF